MRNILSVLSILMAIGTAGAVTANASKPACSVSLHVLGTGQDGGKPQVGNPKDPAWSDKRLRRLATSIALVDDTKGRRRYLFDATPDLKEQIYRLDTVFPSSDGFGIDGIFLTHAHIGHYAGLMFLGHEAAGTRNVPVYAMPRMSGFLRTNGPWSQLVKYENIKLFKLQSNVRISISSVKVTPLLVPHRQEFSEVVAFRIEGGAKSALYLPDIDSWEEWDEQGVRIEDEIAKVDYAFLDATFYANGEIPGRDMSGFPHPFIAHSLERFRKLPDTEKAKIRFIHFNHTNPVLMPGSLARRTVEVQGFRLAQEGERYCLSRAIRGGPRAPGAGLAVRRGENARI